jgi:hypothetical protein
MRAAPEPLPTDTADGSYRLLSWNLHYGVDGDAVTEARISVGAAAPTTPAPIIPILYLCAAKSIP